jgi:hypothetical protein
MNGHHLILGETRDLISGETVPDTLDERYRQKLAHLLLHQRGYGKSEIESNRELLVNAGGQRAILKIDFAIVLSGIAGMIVRYGPGSLVTRRRPALAASRLVAPYQIPVVVVTNGEDAEVLDGSTGKVLSQGLDSVPARADLKRRLSSYDTPPVSGLRREMEARILYAFEVDDSCPCDDTICRL